MVNSVRACLSLMSSFVESMDIYSWGVKENQAWNCGEGTKSVGISHQSGAITCSSELIIDNMSFNVVYVDESIPNVEVIADEFFLLNVNCDLEDYVLSDGKIFEQCQF